MRHRVDFPGMHLDERILLLQRKHWSVVSQDILRFLLLFLLPLVILVFMNISNLGFQVEVEAASGIAIVLGVSAYWLLIWLMFYHDWLDYYLDALIVTNERIVRIEQKGLFNRTVADLTLDRVQDIAVEMKGLLSTFLRFGTLYIQSAAEQRHFVFSHIPNPEVVKAQILTFLPKDRTASQPSAHQTPQIAPHQSPKQEPR